METWDEYRSEWCISLWRGGGLEIHIYLYTVVRFTRNPATLLENSQLEEKSTISLLCALSLGVSLGGALIVRDDTPYPFLFR